jgi:hypothetical protein
MKLYFVCAPVCFAAAVAMLAPRASAQDEADRAKLNGSWQVKEQGATPAVWTIQPQGESMRVTNSEGDHTVAEFVCELAKQCDAKDAGKKVKVMFYFNGAKLVMMETKGDEVVKRRFGFGDAPDVMELDMIPVAPAGKTETTHFTRVQAVAASKP